MDGPPVPFPLDRMPDQSSSQGAFSRSVTRNGRAFLKLSVSVVTRPEGQYLLYVGAEVTESGQQECIHFSVPVDICAGVYALDKVPGVSAGFTTESVAFDVKGILYLDEIDSSATGSGLARGSLQFSTPGDEYQVKAYFDVEGLDDPLESASCHAQG